jgi:LysR family transcriptional regulator, regulator for bpeEF and oprC
MWLASEMAAFAHICELKSFTAAARALGVPKVAVSRAILSLERRLGTRLLNRTTRVVRLTPAGALLQPHSARLLAEVESVRARFAADATLQRRLRVIVDPGYGRLLVMPLIPRFLERYGNIELQVAVIATLPLTAGTDWDLLVCNAVAPSPSTLPTMSALTRTPLGSPPLLLCATPAYLARHGRPRTPAQLREYSVLRALDVATYDDATQINAGVESLPVTLDLRREKPGSKRTGRDVELQQLRLRPALQVNDPALVHASTAAGLGIGVLPEFLCRQGLAMGKLERVLPEWSVAETLQLQAVYAADQDASVATRQFIEFLLASMVPVLSAADASAT